MLGSRVKVEANFSIYNGHVGTVVRQRDLAMRWGVEFEELPSVGIVWFCHSELIVLQD